MQQNKHSPQMIEAVHSVQHMFRPNDTAVPREERTASSGCREEVEMRNGPAEYVKIGVSNGE